MTSLERIHPEEPGAVALLDQAITALTTALDDMPIGEVVNLKAKVATIQTATKELSMSKEAQELAAEAVRRSEWGLGRAIRRGQAEGTIARREDNLRQFPNASHGNSEKGSPTEWVVSNRERDDLYAMADSPDFEGALKEARAEGNLSRANVARKARERSGRAAEAPPVAATERAHQEAELVNAFRSTLRPLLAPHNVATLSPKARDLLVDLLENAITTLKGTER